MMRILPARVCAAAVLLFAAATFGGAAARAASFTIPWGTSATQLGIINQPEQERSGPVTFAISPAGAWIVADSVNGQIKEFAPDGAFVRIVASGVRPSSMAFNADGNLLLLDGHRVTALATGGGAPRTTDLPADLPLIEGYAQEVFAEGDMIGVNDADENCYLFKPGDAKPQAPAAVRTGRAAGTGMRAYTARRGDAIGGALAADGAARGGAGERFIRTAPLDASSARMGAVLFRGMNAGAPVWETEEIAPGTVRLFVRAGADAATAVELPNTYFTTVYKKFEVREGRVYQMLTTPAGVEFSTRRLAQ
jgi:hypothetical protein